PGLPPDPDEAGKATIEGIDSNGNGVRDDIERWIAVKYPNSEKTRAGLVQEARAFQKALTSVQDTPSASAAFDEIAMGTECLSYLVGPYQMREVDKAFLTQMLNTSGRIRANHAWQNLLPAVQSYSPPDGKAACIGFDPDTLPN
ncbi:MAG: hypothetical protein ABI747_03420, partial [Candidatus Moraniibacteriota bacterium]